MNPFSPEDHHIFANSVDPDETLRMSRLIWIYTVCNSVMIFDWDYYLEKWFWPDSMMEESTSETQGWEG